MELRLTKKLEFFNLFYVMSNNIDLEKFIKFCIADRESSSGIRR